MTTPNRVILEAVARRITPLLDEVVFVGGQVAELLITDPAAVRVRATVDVDVVVPVTSRTEYRRTEKHLEALGFRHDMREGAPICRWVAPDGHLLDLMPADKRVLGFSNRNRVWSLRSIGSTSARAPPQRPSRKPSARRFPLGAVTPPTAHEERAP
jgi:hypothetical protein